MNASQPLPDAELERIAATHGARLQVVEVPPGPPVLSPLVAEVYGPDEAGRQATAARIAQAFAATPDIVGIDTSAATAAPGVAMAGPGGHRAARRRPGHR